MRKSLLLTVVLGLITTLAFSQTDRFWSANTESRSSITTDKAVARLSFPKEFKLFSLNIDPLRQELFSIVGAQAAKHSTVISLPNVDGKMEEFEVFEASNFEPALQARFPEIRAYSGKGITDRYATLKLSISPQGVQTMVFRTDKENEFIEAYSKDHTVYAVFTSQRAKGSLPWTCSTEDKVIFDGMKQEIGNANIIESSAGELKTMRLAQSCNGEYANYFGATSSAQVALVLAAFNATLTRCNGCYEKDLALHLDLISATTDVIYYNPATDPYTTLGQWNGQLMNTLKAVIGDANFDIGHMFGASGGGGNAGCIGCVCSNGTTTGTYKGAGITSPADGIPMGDNFDIDYVAHEVGHQLGGNHTFSHGNEGTGVNKEVGSGITIMGYAGITGQDVAPHSIDIFHEATIQQIQNNLATKTCPITTNITANNATPVVAPVSNYTIPISTPFALTGSATDANAGDALTYCWEQNDNSTTTGNASVASPTKVTGPNWLSFPATASPTRLLPRLSTILAGLYVTPTLGGDAVANVEALSSVSRTLNFRLTVRDNSAYSSVAPIKVGQTAFTDMVVTVTNTSGPFQVTSPNTNVSWAGGSSQTITWDVNNTTAAPVSCSDVKISMSTDGGLTFPTVLIASTPNDGSEALIIPAGSTTTARIKIESIGNIFFDISNTNFNVTAPSGTFDFNTPANATVTCGTATTSAITLTTVSNGGYNVPINMVATGVPAGTTITYSVNPVTPGNNTVVTLNNVNTLAPGSYPITITGTSGAIVRTVILTYVVTAGAGPSITTQPTLTAACAGSNKVITVVATGATTYQWQVSPTGVGGPWSPVANGGVYSGATTNALTITGATVAMNGSAYRLFLPGLCASTTSNAVVLTVNALPTVAAVAALASICIGETSTLTASGADTYTWSAGTTPATGAVVTVTPAGTTPYTVTGTTTASGCTNTATVTVTAKPKPTITLTAAPYTSLMPGWVTTLTVNITPVVATNNIVWYKNGVIIPGASGPTRTVTVDELGDYSVSVTSPFSCPGESSSLRIKDSASNKLFISPNPNNGLFKIRYYTNYLNFGFLRTVLIYDSKGAIAYKQRIPITAPYSAMDIDMRNCGKGIYSVVLADSKGKPLAQGKVVIQ